MSNFSAAFGFARICPNFGSPWFGKHFAVLQSWTKLLEKTKHQQNKNHFLTSSSHPLPLCNDNRTQTAKKPLTYCFFLHNSTTVTSPSPPPPYAMLMWEAMLARKLCGTQKTTLSRGGGGEGDLVVCFSTSERAWNANFFYRFCPRQTRFPNYR